jgi:hypothetical protein
MEGPNRLVLRRQRSPLWVDIVEKVENRITPKIPQKLIFGVSAAAKHRGADTKVLGRFCVKR